MSRLPRSTAEAQGLSDAALDSFVGALNDGQPEIQTVMLMRHGHVVLEEEWAPYRLTDRHLLFSVSKSFTSTAVGLAIDAGLLTIDDPVISFFTADELPETISDNLAAMKVRHLLTMTTGHSQDTVEALSRDRRMVKMFLGLEVQHEPGTVFVYNSGATYMLSAIVQRVTGERLLDYLRPRLFEPLGATEATWQVSKEDITVGGWGLSINTESLACFGQLLLQHGEWDGKQLVPAEWYEAATSKQVPNDQEANPDWHQGYGFQFWRGRHNTYRGDGAFGQFCLVFPEYDAVLIVTSATTDMQAILNTVWDYLLPALEGKDVPPVARPEKLELPAPSGSAPAAGDGQTYRITADNAAGLAAVRIDPDGTATFGIRDMGDDGGTHDLVCAAGDWQERSAPGTMPGAADDASLETGIRVVTSAYADGDALVATIRWVETPFVAVLTCRVADGAMTVDAKLNVSFGPTEFTVVSEPMSHS
ncbi:CubicO group peptidase (beta-lactamase class C family) [Kribbella aluminosa]|uniref:CubicO group peptidase (Beta-lactamase class C family) n=1 Tax=Kribbella aluminosa TaxID=416017 RepID=A0ABS4UZD1_9ACTN|nr:serine hydrolase [Kribbella aluminosa]MBP2356972.1 CubicO group peptidase (beta-lactamase class C family) [Kribbella aluminosa]